MQLKECLKLGTDVLRQSGIESAALDAKVLLCHVLDCTAAYLYAHDDRELDNKDSNLFLELIKKRSLNMPVAYLTGFKEFYGLKLKVNSHTLIPRPDTETLVDLVRELDKTHHFKRVLDLGTGSGAIILSLKKYLPNINATASDISKDALAAAEEDAKEHNLSVDFVLSSWFDKIKGSFDLIVSNPPYIEEGDEHLKNLSFEPITALTSGADGLDDIRLIIKDSLNCLEPGGVLALEHGFDQADRVRELFCLHGYQNVRTIQDYQGNDRVTFALRKK